MARKKKLTEEEKKIAIAERKVKLNKLIHGTIQRISKKGVYPMEVAQGEQKIRIWQNELVALQRGKLKI